MSIDLILQKIKPFYFLLLTVVLAGIFFALGRLSSLEGSKTPIKIDYPATTDNTSQVSLASFSVPTTSPAVQESSEVIGSKSGKKYYFPWCGTVKRILPQNQVHFASALEARKAGFTPGGNCKGLQ